MALCNNAAHSQDGSWQGDPTETPLTEVAAGAGLDKAVLDAEWPRVLEQPFDAVRKRMTTFHRTPQGFVAYTKGAPESVIPVCTTYWRDAKGGEALQLDGAAWLARADALAAQGLRVLAVARKTYEHLPDAGGEIDAMESGLGFIGLMGLMDPPRPKALAAVGECKAAGICDGHPL